MTVLPDPGADRNTWPAPLVLPPVKRFNHADGIAPYNGAVAVTENSIAPTPSVSATQSVRAIMHACAAAFTQLAPSPRSGSTAVPVRTAFSASSMST